MTYKLPLVSIIIPVYNAEKYIKVCYDQICNLDYPNLEIIYIDNNSTDQSLNLIKELSDKDTRLKICQEMKQGAGAARNKGVLAATGEFISFLDVDDQISPNKISQHVSVLLDNQGLAMVFGKIHKYYPEKNYGYYIPNQSELNTGRIEPPYLGLHWLENFGRLVNPSAITCTKESIISVNGFEEGLLRGEDAAFMIKMGMNHPIFYLDEVCSTYMRHPSSTISKDNILNNKDPYYEQFKNFYLLYFLRVKSNKYALKLVYRKIYSTIIHGRFMHGRVSWFLKFIHQYREINSFRDNLPMRYKFLMAINSLLPQPFNSFFFKLMLKSRMI